MLIDVLHRIEQRLAELGKSASGASREAGLSPDAIRNMQRYVKQGKINAGVNSNTIARLAPVLDVSPAWLMGEGEGDGPKPIPNASFPPRYQKFPDSTVPLLGQGMTGANGKFILNGQEVGRVFCPPQLEGVEGAYAAKVYGTSMEPKFEAGETIWMHPWTPVRSGDYVLAQIHTADGEPPESYIKRFVSQSSKVLRLHQFNPEEGEPHDLEFPAERVFSVHKIVFQALV